MALIKKHIISTLTFLVTYFGANAQDTPTIEAFTAYENNGKVHLSWVMTAGSICNGIVILRSNDSINFTYAGDIPGVCGNITSEETYSFVDENPFKNQRNYYKLEFGGLSVSHVIAINVAQLAISGHITVPNPANNVAKVFYNNTDRSSHSITIYNYQGIKQAEMETTYDYFEVDVSALKSGTYYFMITSAKGEVITQGKIAVLH